jgi:hypothetical protein
MAISGHKTRSVFDRYNSVSEEDLAAAVDRTNAYVAQAQEEPSRVLAVCAAVPWPDLRERNAHDRPETLDGNPGNKALNA